MSHWCESCGQELPEGEVPNRATWLGEPAEGREYSFSRPAGSSRGGRDKKIVLAVAGVIMAWGMFVGVSQVVSPDDAIDEQAAADIEEARAERQERDEAEADAEQSLVGQDDEAPAAPTPEFDESLYNAFAAADAAPNVPDESDENAANARQQITVQVERLQRQLIRRDSTAVAAYRSADGVVVVDMAAGTARVTELTTGATTLDAGAFLLRSGADTFALDPASLAVAQVVDDASLVVTQTQDGNSYFVGAASLNEYSAVVEVVADQGLSAHVAPGGYTLLALDGLGLVAIPKGPTGSTLIASDTEFVTLSENRVLSANSNAMLEQVCTNPASCSLAVTTFESREQWGVPTNFSRLGDQYKLSPDSGALLRYTAEGFAEVYENDSEDLSWVIGAGMQAPAWGPNSDFIIWLDLVGDPKLKVMFVDERDWLTIDLRDLGAPAPVGPELIVFTPTHEPST